MRAYAMILVAAGIATTTVSLILAAVVPLVFVLQGAIARSPPVESVVRIRREITPETPLPGQPVEVTLTIENAGETAIPDLRFVDGVPDELGVTDGSPRGGRALASGGQFTRTYTLAADRGTYAFDDVTVRGRNATGTRLADATVRATGTTEFECRVTVEDIPVQQTTAYAGQLATNTGGAGIEFFATREYRPGDPVKRIDWKQYAKTGELATVDFREQHAAHIVVLIDSRQPAHTAADQTAPTGATLSAYAATLALDVLVDEGHHVSLGALGIADPTTDTDPPAWVSSDEGKSFVSHATAVCNAAATTASAPDERAADPNTSTAAQPSTATQQSPAVDGGVDWHRVRSLVPTSAEVVLCTPGTDDRIVDLVESLRGDGHDVTMLSPQTVPETVGGRTVALERAVRLDQVRLLGATVIDWNDNEQLPVALARVLKTGVR